MRRLLALAGLVVVVAGCSAVKDQAELPPSTTTSTATLPTMTLLGPSVVVTDPPYLCIPEDRACTESLLMPKDE